MANQQQSASKTVNTAALGVHLHSSRHPGSLSQLALRRRGACMHTQKLIACMPFELFLHGWRLEQPYLCTQGIDTASAIAQLCEAMSCTLKASRHTVCGVIFYAKIRSAGSVDISIVPAMGDLRMLGHEKHSQICQHAVVGTRWHYLCPSLDCLFMVSSNHAPYPRNLS